MEARSLRTARRPRYWIVLTLWRPMSGDTTSYALRVDQLVAGYGKKQVLRKINIDIPVGEIVALIGHNGAGKSTLLNALFGLLPIWEGRVLLFGKPIVFSKPRELLRSGVAYEPQG